MVMFLSLFIYICVSGGGICVRVIMRLLIV